MKKMGKNRVVYIPIPTHYKSANENESNKVSVLKSRYIIDTDFADFFDIWTMINTKAVIMGWIEERLTWEDKLHIILYRLFGTKIIWTFHNKAPHDSDNKNAKENMKWLANISDIIWIHSKNSIFYLPGRKKNIKKAVYIPHSNYSFQPESVYEEKICNKYGINKGDFVYLFFGLIRPYKNIEGCIRAFSALNISNAKLIIAGRLCDVEYGQRLLDEAGKNSDITIDFQYITPPLLDILLFISDVVVIPYHEETCLNSGVMMHAFSSGTPVIMPEICCASDFYNKEYLYLFHGDGLMDAMRNVYNVGKEKNKQIGKEASKHVNNENNYRVIKKEILRTL